MEEKKKAEHLLVVYANTGEHIMIDYDRMVEEIDTKRLELFRNKTDENGETKEEWIATFYRENIAGWEKLR